jgi:nucleoside-diphosphate-sugar epimerase
MLNGGPDTVVYNAGLAGKIGTYVIYPCIIYGRSAGPVNALGVIQYFMHLKVKELGFVPYIGAGTAITNALHVNTTVDFTLLVLAQSLKEDQPQGSVYERVYFIGGKEAPWKDVANWFAKAFFAAGVSKEDKARSVSVEEAGEGEIPMLMSRDMKFISPRAQELGFRGNDNSDQFKEFLSVRADIFPA